MFSKALHPISGKSPDCVVKGKSLKLAVNAKKRQRGLYLIIKKSGLFFTVLILLDR